MADLGKQQPQIIAGFSGGADRGAARAAAVFVRDGDRRRNALDPVGGRLFQSFQKLPRVGRKAVDVAALSLRVQGVQRQARLAAAAQAAEDDQLAVRNIEINLLEIVNRDAAKTNRTDRHYSHPWPDKMTTAQLVS